jgi:hypothetical protein
MPKLEDWEPTIDVDDVLRGQGADPAAIRARSPHLVETAARALKVGRAMLQPQTVYRTFEVEGLRHERLTLAGGGTLSGPLIAQHLGPAERVVALICTIGPALEELSARVIQDELVYGLALDGVGSAAVEALANWACRQFEVEAALSGMQTTIPLSPGMLGWPIEIGQPQIFSLMDEVDITLTEYGTMIPRKSLSMVLGIGAEISSGGRTCDYCSMRETCRYQDHYEPATT